MRAAARQDSKPKDRGKRKDKKKKKRKTRKKESIDEYMLYVPFCHNMRSVNYTICHLQLHELIETSQTLNCLFEETWILDDLIASLA